MICEKCKGTNFEDWSAKGAKFKTCLSCYHVYQITQSDELNAYREEAKQVRQASHQSNKQIEVTCPYCKSTNTSKVGVISRSVSFGVFGFGSGKVGKQWHCNSCRSDF